MSFLWNASCGCGGLLTIGDLMPEAGELMILMGFLLYFVPLVIYLIVMITSHTLYSARRSRGVFLFGLGLIQLEYLFGTVRLMLIIQALLDRGRSEVFVFLNALSLALAIGLLISSTLAWRQLSREAPLPEQNRDDPEEE